MGSKYDDEGNIRRGLYNEKGELIKYCVCGSGCGSFMFKCSKCGKLYPTLGGLKYYHKKCLEEEKKR